MDRFTYSDVYIPKAEKKPLTFFETHREEIISLYSLADIDGELPDDITDPMVIHDYSLSRWMKGDHWNPDNKYAYSVEQSDLEEFYQILDRLQLREEIIPPAGTVIDELVIVGSTFSANFRRASLGKQLIDSGQVSFRENPNISIWAGQRPSYASEEIDFDGFLGAGYSDVHDVFKDETDMANFVVHTLWGMAENGKLLLPDPAGIYLPEPAVEGDMLSAQLEDIPPLSELGVRDFAQYEYLLPRNNHTIKILNARAVERRQGEPRHTTESSAREWLALNNIPVGYTVLEINGNPHAYRINSEIKRVFTECGRPDIKVVSAAIAARQDSPPSLYLGEIGRILFNNY
jgi:hypothetical protein